MNATTHGQAVIDHYRRITNGDSDEPETTLADLLADLMLWSAFRRHDWAAAAARAEQYATDEQHCAGCGSDAIASLNADLLCPRCSS